MMKSPANVSYLACNSFLNMRFQLFINEIVDSPVVHNAVNSHKAAVYADQFVLGQELLTEQHLVYALVVQPFGNGFPRSAPCGHFYGIR